MGKLIGRIGIWAVVLVAVLAGSWWCKRQLDVRRHPTESMVIGLLEKRLGGMTPDQRAMVRDLAGQYPIETVLAAHRDGWEGLDRLRAHGPDMTQKVQVLAFKAGEEQLDQEAAVEFANVSLSLLWAIEEEDAPYAASILDAVHRLSPEEYRNVAFDPSYAQIAPHLETKYREEFRKNQDILTPLLAVATQDEWNAVMGHFQAAQPRAGEIFRDAELGPPFALVYILNRELVQALQAQGVQEQDAISFLGCNADTARLAKEGDPSWAAGIRQMQQDSGPAADDGTAMSLFDWACNDPAVYWLIRGDVSPNKDSSRKVLARYAGTVLPTVLTLQYSESPELLRAAIEALARFDNESDPKPERRGTAAQFLCRYHKDGVFKDELRKHGAILIPALGAGGEEDLARIQKNPNDVYKHVDEDGKPKGSPWWTWIPGGNIAIVFREMMEGRTVTFGEWAWAGVDLAILVPVVGQAGKLARPAFAATREGLKAAGKTAGKSVLKREARSMVAAGIRQGASRLLPRAVASLWAAGRAIGKNAAKIIAGAGALAAKHPVKSLVAAIMIYSQANPDGARELIRRIVGNIAGPITGVSTELAKALAGLPGKLLVSIWDTIHSLAKKHPMLAPVFYFWFVLLVIVTAALPIIALRVFLRPVYDFLASACRRVTKWLRRSDKHPSAQPPA